MHLLLTIDQISRKVDSLRTLNASRDQRMMDIMAIRSGEVEKAFPEQFSEDFPKPIIANFIDVAAKDTSETLAPLPAFNCSATNMVSDAARKAADKRTKGAASYVEWSKLQTQMYRGADWYVTFGFMPISVEPDYDAQCPRFLIESPLGAYPEFDRWGRTISFSRRFKRRIVELCSEWPEYADQISGAWGRDSSAMVELVLYKDKDQTLLYIPERANLVLGSPIPQPLGECPVTVARRPSVDESTHGQFDDIAWVQLARHRFSMLAMEAAELSVQAPLALPLDVQEFAIGPHATLKSNSPEKIRRVGIEMPQGAMLESQALDNELRTGARYPGTRSGQSPGSIVTGQAVHALEGGFDSQIKAAQDIFAETFKEAMRKAFMLDEKLWPDVERSLQGNASGVPYEIKWKPSRDINGSHHIDVSYGFAMGLDPNRSLVFLLQLLGGRLVSKDMVRRQFPFGVDVTQEEQRIEIEDLRDALVQSVAAYAQSIPVLAEQGQDPAEPLMKITQIIKGRAKGRALEDIISDAFAPQPPPTPPGATGPGGVPGPGGPGDSGPGGQIPFGMQPSGLPNGVAPGQATMGPGGRPDLQTMLAGLNSGGGPTLTSNVKRSLPAG